MSKEKPSGLEKIAGEMHLSVKGIQTAAVENPNCVADYSLIEKHLEECKGFNGRTSVTCNVLVEEARKSAGVKLYCEFGPEEYWKIVREKALRYK